MISQVSHKTYLHSNILHYITSLSSEFRIVVGLSPKVTDDTHNSLDSLCHICDVFSLRLGICNTKLGIAGYCVLIIRTPLLTKESNPIRFKRLLENMKE